MPPIDEKKEDGKGAEQQPKITPESKIEPEKKPEITVHKEYRLIKVQQLETIMMGLYNINPSLIDAYITAADVLKSNPLNVKK